MIAGGFDNFSREGLYEFANTGTMSNPHTEFVMGQEPNEMSCPTASTCDGVIFYVEINDSIIDTSFSSWKLKVVVCKYCQSQLNPASFAAQWMGKDAVFKSLGVTRKGAVASMQDIEILSHTCYFYMWMTFDLTCKIWIHERFRTEKNWTQNQISTGFP